MNHPKVKASLGTDLVFSGLETNQFQVSNLCRHMSTALAEPSAPQYRVLDCHPSQILAPCLVLGSLVEKAGSHELNWLLGLCFAENPVVGKQNRGSSAMRFWNP
jgi:hypothetical protein